MGVVPRGVKMIALLLLPLVCSALGYQDPDQDLVGDIFGTQQLEETGRSIQEETRCDDLRPCVECSVFKQYWKHYGSAYECYESCKQYSFVTHPDEESLCTLDSCSAQKANGIGVSCQ